MLLTGENRRIKKKKKKKKSHCHFVNHKTLRSNQELSHGTVPKCHENHSRDCRNIHGQIDRHKETIKVIPNFFHLFVVNVLEILFNGKECTGLRRLQRRTLVLRNTCWPHTSGISRHQQWFPLYSDIQDFFSGNGVFSIPLLDCRKVVSFGNCFVRCKFLWGSNARSIKWFNNNNNDNNNVSLDSVVDVGTRLRTGPSGVRKVWRHCIL
jgi:hypothetical protein